MVGFFSEQLEKKMFFMSFFPHSEAIITFSFFLKKTLPFTILVMVL